MMKKKMREANSIWYDTSVNLLYGYVLMCVRMWSAYNSAMPVYAYFLCGIRVVCGRTRSVRGVFAFSALTHKHQRQSSLNWMNENEKKKEKRSEQKMPMRPNGGSVMN